MISGAHLALRLVRADDRTQRVCGGVERGQPADTGTPQHGALTAEPGKPVRVATRPQLRGQPVHIGLAEQVRRAAKRPGGDQLAAGVGADRQPSGERLLDGRRRRVLHTEVEHPEIGNRRGVPVQAVRPDSIGEHPRTINLGHRDTLL